MVVFGTYSFDGNPKKIEEKHETTPMVSSPEPVESSSYRPCLMVADTSDQAGEESNSNIKVRRPRTCFSDEQLKELERRFRINKYVSVADRTLLCSELGLTDSQIKTWFQNRRTKWKRLNEARYNLLSNTTDDRLFRKEIPYYVPSYNTGLSTSSAFPSKLSAESNHTGAFNAVVSNSPSHPSLYNSFPHSFHTIPNYVWGSYSPVYNNPTSSSHPTSPHATPAVPSPINPTTLTPLNPTPLNPTPINPTPLNSTTLIPLNSTSTTTLHVADSSQSTGPIYNSSSLFPVTTLPLIPLIPPPAQDEEEPSQPSSSSYYDMSTKESTPYTSYYPNEKRPSYYSTTAPSLT